MVFNPSFVDIHMYRDQYQINIEGSSSFTLKLHLGTYIFFFDQQIKVLHIFLTCIEINIKLTTHSFSGFVISQLIKFETTFNFYMLYGDTII